MCIIAAKPAGTKMPDDRTIATMWAHNPDGAGYMYAYDGKVRIHKGFMSLNALKQSLADTSKRVNLDETAVVLHFRIQTHGGVCKENCHPFPVSRSIKSLQATSINTSLGVAHNGIIPVTPRKGISDTMEYIASQLAPLYSAMPDFYRNNDALELVRNAIKSKLAIMNGAGEITLIGDFNEDEGIQYSNYSYIGSSWTYYTPHYVSYTPAKGAPEKGGGWDSYSPWDGGLDDEDDSAYCIGQAPLMWADLLPKGGFVAVGNDYSDDLSELLIGPDGRVYEYDWELDCAVWLEDAVIYTAEGMTARFDDEKADLERVLLEDYYPEEEDDTTPVK